MISSYKHVGGSSFSFSGVKKDVSIYFIKPEGRIFIQTPCVIARDAFVSADTNALTNSAALVVPSRFTAWVKSIEQELIDYAVANKADLFAKDLEDEFIRSAFRSSTDANMWRVNIHPDVSVFDKDKHLATPEAVKDGARLVCLFTLNSVRFTRKAFYAKWVLRSVRLCGTPEYQFIDEDDDFTPAHSIVDEETDVLAADTQDAGTEVAAEPEATNLTDSTEIQVPLPEAGSQESPVEPDTADTMIRLGEEPSEAHTDDEHPLEGAEVAEAATAYQFVVDTDDLPPADEPNEITNATAAHDSDGQREEEECKEGTAEFSATAAEASTEGDGAAVAGAELTGAVEGKVEHEAAAGSPDAEDDEIEIPVRE